MRRRKAGIVSVTAVAVILGAVLVGWQVGWPPALFGGPHSAQPMEPHI